MLCRYVFTAYNLKDAEQADVTEVAVYATNEGEALHKASQVAVRAHYKPEAVEEIPNPLEGETGAADDVPPAACRNCIAEGDCDFTPDTCNVLNQVKAEVTPPQGDEE